MDDPAAQRWAAGSCRYLANDPRRGAIKLPQSTDHDLPLFAMYPELLTTPPVWSTDDRGRWILKWRARREQGDVIIVLHATFTSKPMWDYAIFDASTNTVRKYLGPHCDPREDNMTALEEGIAPP